MVGRFAAAVNGYRDRAAILMIPSLMAACLSDKNESKQPRDPLEIARVALGIHNLGAVRWQFQALLAIFFSNHGENIVKFR